MSCSPGFPKVRFSTAALPRPERVAMWREHYAHTIFRADVRPACASSFQATVTSRALPQLHLLSGALSAVRIERTREFLADGNDDVQLVINRAGRISAIARGREVALREGDAVLVNSGELSVFDRATSGGSFSIRIPHSVLAPLVIDLDDAVMRLIPRRASALRLLASYARPLLEQDMLETPELQRLAVTHVHDLVALALGATRDAGDLARSRGRGAALLRAAKAYIIENSRTPTLSVGSVAQHLAVTPRYLQKLFETDGATFSNFLLGQRLARTHRMLTDPRFDALQVSSIAYEAGFGDLSYFNRNFRNRYDATPREVRKSRVR
jgi:AraC-like DNA-binding protein